MREKRESERKIMCERKRMRERKIICERKRMRERKIMRGREEALIIDTVWLTRRSREGGARRSLLTS